MVRGQAFIIAGSTCEALVSRRSTVNKEHGQRTGLSQTPAVEEAVRRHLADMGVDVESKELERRMLAARNIAIV